LATGPMKLGDTLPDIRDDESLKGLMQKTQAAAFNAKNMIRETRQAMEDIEGVHDLIEVAKDAEDLEEHEIDTVNVALEHHAKCVGVSGAFRLTLENGRVSQASMEGIGDMLAKLFDVIRRKIEDIIRAIKQFFDSSRKTFDGMQKRVNKLAVVHSKMNGYQANAMLEPSKQQWSALVKGEDISRDLKADLMEFADFAVRYKVEIGSKVLDGSRHIANILPDVPLDDDIAFEDDLAPKLDKLIRAEDFEKVTDRSKMYLGTVNMIPVDFRPRHSVPKWAEPMLVAAGHPGVHTHFNERLHDRTVARMQGKLPSLTHEQVGHGIKGADLSMEAAVFVMDDFYKDAGEILRENRNDMNYVVNRANPYGLRLSTRNVQLVNLLGLAGSY